MKRAVLLTTLFSFVASALPFAALAADEIPSPSGLKVASSALCSQVMAPVSARPSVVIVDPLATGRMNAEVYLKRGYKVIHLLSAPIPKALAGSYQRQDCWDPDTGNYQEKYFTNLTETLDWLKQRGPISAVLTGADSGTELADAVGSALGLPSNDPATSAMRREKYLMSERIRQSPAIRAAGYRGIREHQSGNLEDLLRWQRDEYQKWPVIVKPGRGAGSNKVRQCFNVQDVKAAYELIYAKPNIFDEIVYDVIIQEDLKTPESDLYIVDMVTADGVHKVTHIYKYTLIQVSGGAYINDRVEMLPSTGEIQNVLVDYAKKINDALDLRVGSSHHEIFWINGEPVFIEVGPRIGGMIPKLSADATGGVFNQLELNANAYLDPKSAFDGLPEKYDLKKVALNVFLNVDSEGKTEDRGMAEWLRTLPSYYEHSFYRKPGEALPRTLDLASARGYVFLLNADREQLMKDYEAIRARERSEGFIH